MDNKLPILNRRLNNIEEKYFNLLFNLKQQQIAIELETMTKMGFAADEIYFMWDWFDEDIQVVPSCMVLECKADH